MAHIEIRVGGCNAVDGPKDKQDVELFFAGTLKSDAVWERSQTAVASAAESLRITQVRYREGVAGITNLLTAQVGLIAMRTRSVAAADDHATAVSNLQRARGELCTGCSV